MEVLAAVRECADRYTHPDEEYGYGIPDFNLADVLLKVALFSPEFPEKVSAFPNPFRDQLYIIFQLPVDVSIEVSLFDLAGKEIIRDVYPPFPGRNFLKIEGDLSNLPKGVYILRVNAGPVNSISKLIRF